MTILIDVFLIRVRNQRTVVHEAIPRVIGIPEAIAIDVRARVAGVARSVPIGISLSCIWDRGTIVAGVARTIPVRVDHSALIPARTGTPVTADDVAVIAILSRVHNAISTLGHATVSAPSNIIIAPIAVGPVPIVALFARALAHTIATHIGLHVACPGAAVTAHKVAVVTFLHSCRQPVPTTARGAVPTPRHIVIAAITVDGVPILAFLAARIEDAITAHLAHFNAASPGTSIAVVQVPVIACLAARRENPIPASWTRPRPTAPAAAKIIRRTRIPIVTRIEVENSALSIRGITRVVRAGVPVVWACHRNATPAVDVADILGAEIAVIGALERDTGLTYTDYACISLCARIPVLAIGAAFANTRVAYAPACAGIAVITRGGVERVDAPRLSAAIIVRTYIAVLTVARGAGHTGSSTARISFCASIAIGTRVRVVFREDAGAAEASIVRTLVAIGTHDQRALATAARADVSRGARISIAA